jgi:hypothetical protein
MKNPAPKTLLLAIVISASCGCSKIKSFFTAESLVLSTEPHVVILNWQPSPQANSYRIHRAPRLGGPYQEIATSTAPTFLDFISAPATFYYYVTAINEHGESPPSARFRVSLP